MAGGARGWPFAAALGLAGVFLVLNGGSAIARFSPRTGAVLAPWNSELQRVAAFRELRDGRRAGARAFAVRSLRAMPFNQSSLTIVSLDLPGARGVAALNASAALGWRDPLTNIRLVRAALGEGQPDIAAQRIDALGRITANNAHTGALADALLGMPGGASALAERAAAHLGHGWFPDWLSSPPATPQVMAGRIAFARLLDPDLGEWRRMVIGHTMSGIAASGKAGSALALWRETLADKARLAGTVYDVDFFHVGEGQPLGSEWALPESPAALIETREAGGLRLTTIDAAPGPVLSQMIEMGATGLFLVSRWQGEEARVRTFEWRLTCASGAPVPLARILVRNGTGWRDEYRASPGSNCPIGYLTLALGQRPGTEGTVDLLSVKAPVS